MLNQLIISVACVFNFLTVAEKLCGDCLTLLLLSMYSYSQNKDASHVNYAGVTINVEAPSLCKEQIQVHLMSQH